MNEDLPDDVVELIEEVDALHRGARCGRWKPKTTTPASSTTGASMPAHGLRAGGIPSRDWEDLLERDG